MSEEIAFKTQTIVQGEFDTSNDPMVCFSTILGSCVSICLYDTGASVGGMNHFLLPGDLNGNSQDKKYGVHAMELLINRLLGIGARRENFQAKVFGGANMNTGLRDIGRLNGEFAHSFLQLEGIPIVSESLGGSNARRIRFWPTTGAAKQLLVPDQDFKVKETPTSVKSEPETSISLF